MVLDSPTDRLFFVLPLGAEILMLDPVSKKTGISRKRGP